MKQWDDTLGWKLYLTRGQERSKSNSVVVVVVAVVVVVIVVQVGNSKMKVS